ncbi:MAG TPA: FG-GAP-like repeat-containing protein, partial [Bacteroidales bacterium]
MRRIIFVIILLFEYHTLFAQSCDFTKNRIVTNSLCTLSTTLANSDATLTADEEIVFIPGFNANGANFNGHTFRAVADHTVTKPIDIGDPLDYTFFPVYPEDGTTRALNKTNCIPGSIGGTIDVNSTGAVSFVLPIQVAPGSHEAQPDLSIAYNSQSDNGILGYGFHLSGISAITIANKSPYYEDSFGEAKAFFLDGVRLINTDVNVYYPENDPYTRIQFTSKNGYTGSVVTTRDGSILEYGFSSDSQFNLGNSSMAYAYSISKMTDKDGNTITYRYAGDSKTGEYNISEINYAGNNSVRFYYAKGRPDANSMYISGGKKSRTMLLTAIKVYSEGTLSKDYEFSYSWDFLYSKLNKISLTADGVTYNPTIINWGGLDTSGPTTVSVLKDVINIDSKIYFGDFNGDGIQDRCYINSDGTLLTMTLAKGGTYTQSIAKYGKIEPKVSMADFYNSGTADVMINTGAQLLRYSYHTDSNISTEIIRSSATGENYCFGDFNGDGQTDYLISKNGVLSGGSLPLGGSLSMPLDSTGTQIADFDGDGQVELLNFQDKSVWKFNGSGFTKIYSNLTLGLQNETFFGDYNGDGKTDYLTLVNNQFHEYFATGNGFEEGVLPYPLNTITTLAGSYNAPEDITAMDDPTRTALFDYRNNHYHMATDFLLSNGTHLSAENYKHNLDSIKIALYPIHFFHLVGDTYAEITDLSQIDALGGWNRYEVYVSHGNSIEPVCNLTRPNGTKPCDDANVVKSVREFLALSEYPALYHTHSTIVPIGPTAICPYDADGDGKTDLLVAKGGDLYVFGATGSSFIYTGTSYKISDVSYMNTVSLFIADIDGDGVKDIVYGNDDIDGSVP